MGAMTDIGRRDLDAALAEIDDIEAKLEDRAYEIVRLREQLTKVLRLLRDSLAPPDDDA
jgi:hypothetical protein